MMGLRKRRPELNHQALQTTNPPSLPQNQISKCSIQSLDDFTQVTQQHLQFPSYDLKARSFQMALPEPSKDDRSEGRLTHDWGKKSGTPPTPTFQLSLRFQPIIWLSTE